MTVMSDGAAADEARSAGAAGETAYCWDMTSDTIEWERNARTVLGVATLEEVATGARFSQLIATEHHNRRVEAIGGLAQPCTDKGTPYRLQYRFMPGGPRSHESLWLEDSGRWWAGPDGLPVRARGVVRVIGESYWEEQRLLCGNDHDELTGQLNRIRLTDALGAVLARATRSGQSAAFLVIAVNNLAIINETFGFDVGDEVITSVGRLVKSVLRGGDTIGRYSSNKFGIIVNDCGATAMKTAAERFMRVVREATIRTSACQLSATISVGGVLLPAQATGVAQAVSYALEALDSAKSTPVEAFIAYEPSPKRESLRRRNIGIADEIIGALDEDRLELALQPIVRSNGREIACYEALLRLRKRDGSIVSAGQFIEVGEQLGLSRLIDRRTLELAIGVMNRHPDIRLSINVSSLTCHDHTWLTALQREIAGRRNLAQRLTIEITETTAIHDLDQTASFVDLLRELGCRVAIDDFGAGYTSFRNLKHLAVDIVKIDGSFVRNIAEDLSDRIFIRTMVELASSFGMETVAEWVGDAETARICAEAGVTYLQGFHFGEPVLASTLDAAPAADEHEPAELVAAAG